MYGYIYETTNLINGKKYRGKRVSSILDASYLGSGRRLRYAIEKYGIDSFSVKVLEWCENKQQLNNREIYWINNLKESYPKDLIYNIAKGGTGGDTFANNDKLILIKKKISEAHKGRIIVNKDGKEFHIKPELLDKYISSGYSIGRGDFIKSETYRKAQGDRNRGRVRSKEYREKLSKSLKGRKFSDEWKKNLSEAAKTRVSTFWVYKDSKETKVRAEQLDLYLAKGYKRGRIKK